MVKNEAFLPGGLRGMAGDPKTFHVSLVVVPEVDGSALLGLHGALQLLDTLAACLCAFMSRRCCPTPLQTIAFQENIDHGDRLIASTQDWLKANSHEPDAIEKAVTLSGLAARTFYRRFSQATDLSPIHYVQHLRVEKAKQALELGTATVEQISWQVGYEDPASFRRLFKRLTGMTPSAYRRKFKISQ